MKLITFTYRNFMKFLKIILHVSEGFTEWVNVKKAKPLYWGHHQPRKPLHDNYYNLLDNGVMEWQMTLAKRAGIYGFCFYHYWFGKRMVLEKPVQMLLNNKK